MYWRIVGASNKPITCALYRTKAGLEVRATRSATGLLFSYAVRTESDGASCAARWKAAILGQGGFIDA